MVEPISQACIERLLIKLQEIPILSPEKERTLTKINSRASISTVKQATTERQFKCVNGFKSFRVKNKSVQIEQQQQKQFDEQRISFAQEDQNILRKREPSSVLVKQVLNKKIVDLRLCYKRNNGKLGLRTIFTQQFEKLGINVILPEIKRNSINLQFAPKRAELKPSILAKKLETNYQLQGQKIKLQIDNQVQKIIPVQSPKSQLAKQKIQKRKIKEYGFSDNHNELNIFIEREKQAMSKKFDNKHDNMSHSHHWLKVNTLKLIQ